MRHTGPWAAFLLTCFAIVGLTGLFGTYATTLPLERAMARTATLDQALVADAARLQALRPALGELAGSVIGGPGALADRVAAARRTVLDEAARETEAVSYRIRLMVIVVTLLGAGIGFGILAFASRAARG